MASLLRNLGAATALDEGIAPIVLSAVVVFVASSLVHMLLPFHKSDYRKLPNEDATLDALRSPDLVPGIYHFPYMRSPKEMKSPELLAKCERGPVGLLTVLRSGRMNMGKYLGQWFLFCLLVGFFCAYLAGHTVPMGARYLAVFRVVGTTAFMAYNFGQIQDSIWKGQPWGATWKHVFDGLLYSLLTAGVFGWLWPR